MIAIPDLATLAAFFVAAIVLTLTPGPDMTLFIGRAVALGRKAGLAAFAGASTGLVGHTLLATFGLSALLAASPTAFLALKTVGAIYLLWLALQALRGGTGLTLEAQQGGGSLWASYATGVLVNLLNPKIVVFFVTFLPQFVSPNDPNAAGQLLFLGLFFIVIATPISVALVLSAGAFSAYLKRNPRVTRLVDYAFAGVMGGFALKLLATRAG